MSQRTFRKKYLVIDDANALDVNNLQRKVNQASKHPEPVLRADAPWNLDTETICHMNVIHDEGVFKMWYCVGHYAGEGHDGPNKLAYATSTDGIHWDRPELGLVEINGSKKNNYLIPAINVVPAIINDPSDIPERRYKMIFTGGGTDSAAWARYHSPLNLAYSADGLHWERPVHVNPVLRGISDDCFSLIYDADRRKYLLFTRRVPNLPRDISMYESCDLVNWEDRGRVIVPDDRDPPEMYNLYYMTPFRYDDFFLSMLSTQYTSPVSETYDSFHRSPDYPDTRMGQVDIQLAYSRDGHNWQRPDDRTAVVPCGEPGSIDAGGLYPAHNPIVKDGETWIFYVQQRNRHSWWDIQERWEREQSVKDSNFGMLARMPEDRWVYLDAGGEEGCMMTKPIPFAPEEQLESGEEILVNADASGGAIEAELVTPFGQVVEGFGRGDCVPVTSDGKDQPVRWKGDRGTGKLISEHVGGLCLKLYLKNARLYSYTIEKSDPEGKVAQFYANARWCELIKHRSDNRGRLSTEPAIGLPPHSGPGPEKGQEKPGEMILDF